ncbi:MAG TPA: alpha/beta fold hydrolase [Opitutales bacterium]|nr:alpha/beta fold hydrolase [Opitutales bacterium]
MPVELAYRYFGGEGNPPLVILHGLLGSSRNWTTAGKLLARSFEVFALDLRGHGDSPWAPPPERDYSFKTLAGDVAAWLAARGVAHPVLLGHSLGGKITMRLAADQPKLVRALIVADIAPRDYPPHHAAEFAAMLELDLAKLTSRGEAEKILLAKLHDEAMARFLLTNLVREADDHFRWRVDVAGLAAALSDLSRSSLKPGEAYPGPTLFLRGDQSDYVREGDRPLIAALFPRHQILAIGRAGHNLHVDQPAAFAAALEYFGMDLP